MSGIYGCVAEFSSAGELLEAVRRVIAAGHVKCEAYAPYAVPGLQEALRTGRDRVPALMLLGGFLGGAGTYLLEWYSAVIAYPIDVGGRPAASWPAFVPPAAEMTLLWAAIFGFLAFLWGSGLPRLRHPVFEALAADRVTRNRFMLVVRGDDPRFELRAVETLLRSLEPLSLQRLEARQ